MNQRPDEKSSSGQNDIGGIDPPCLENPTLPHPRMLDAQERIYPRDTKTRIGWGTPVSFIGVGNAGGGLLRRPLLGAEIIFFRPLTRAGMVLAFLQPQSCDWGYLMSPAEAGLGCDMPATPVLRLGLPYAAR